MIGSKFKAIDNQHGCIPNKIADKTKITKYLPTLKAADKEVDFSKDNCEIWEFDLTTKWGSVDTDYLLVGCSKCKASYILSKTSITSTYYECIFSPDISSACRVKSS